MRFVTMTAAAIAVTMMAGSGFCKNKEAMPQGIAETVVELSNEAKKGFMVGAASTSDGGFEVTYALPGKKEDAKVTQEIYPFDASLTAGKPLRTEVAKEMFQSKSESSLTASVGGSNSFNAISMKLKLKKQVVECTWNQNAGKYSYKFTTNTELVPKSPANDEYIGYSAFYATDTSELAVLASYEAGGKSDSLRYGIVFFDKNGNKKKEIPIPFDYPQSVMYSALLPINDSITSTDLSNSDIGIFFAPKEDAKNIRQVTFVRIDRTGAITQRLSFDRPRGVMIINGLMMQGGSLYVLGMSTKDNKKAFEEDFSDYATISSPIGMSYGETMYYSNLRDVEYESINVFKITSGKLDFMSNTVVKDLKQIAKPATGQKKAIVYNGSNISLNSFFTTKSGTIIALFNTVNFSVSNNFSSWEYTGFYYMLFNASATVIAQYGYERLADDKKDLVFQPVNMLENAINDVAFWSVLEPKGFKSFESVMDAFYGRATIRPHYFPRIAKTNVATGTMDFQYTMGQGEYYLYPKKNNLLLPDGSAKIYIGSDGDNKKLWVGKISLKN